MSRTKKKSPPFSPSSPSGSSKGDLRFLRTGRLLCDGSIHVGYFPHLPDNKEELWCSDDELSHVIEALIDWYKLTNPMTVEKIIEAFLRHFPDWKESDEEPCFHIYLDSSDDIEKGLKEFDSQARLFIEEVRSLIHRESDFRKMVEGIEDVQPAWAEKQTI